MIRKTLSASVLAALFLAAPAFAEESTIGRPIDAGSLHEGHLDMVVYYVPVEGDLLEVTATFAPKIGGDPQRVVMGLADGDSVAFSMPGHRGSLYAFSRSGEEVTVSSETGMRADANALTRLADGSLRAPGREPASVGPM
ncbi:hypothetical protein [Mesorhizobium sp.]|uniref:hypothetical protein n=1 Tax=Mesorhizobium sp. TaxID=1871066 RepID=UPI0025BFD10C|nr:hypothetical protein [Mesorhizobium sp.]